MGEWLRPEQEQMEQYAEAFYGLAEQFQKLPCQKERLSLEELRILLEGVKERVCQGCDRSGACWGRGYYQSFRVMYELLREMERSGSFSPEQEELLAGYCARGQQLALTLQAGYEEARSNMLWSNRMLEQRRAAGEQIYQTAELFRRTARGFTDLPELENRIGRRLGRELCFLDVELDDIRAFSQGSGGVEFYLTLHSVKRGRAWIRSRMGVFSGAGAPAGRGVGKRGADVLRKSMLPRLLVRGRGGSVVSARTVAEALSDCCGERMCPAWNCQAAVTAEPMLFHFVPDTRYRFFCGVARITKAGELISGDNFTLLQKDNGKVIMSLADGMGSGTEANRESETVVEMLEQLLSAGFPQESAVRLINSCMLLQSSSQIFSTIDLCMVDLYNATCDMMKSGAAASFLCREGEIEVIRSNAFPAGVLQQSDYESQHRKLEPGESIVMMTDGVLDAMPEENREQAMAELIVRTRTRNAEEYARRLMERVYLKQEMQARDDMTILVGTLWEK